MARKIVVTYQGAEHPLGFSRLAREKLYGGRRREVLDHEGRPCERAALTQDGALIVQKGMTAQAYFDEAGRTVDRRDLVGLDVAGNVLERLPTTLNVPQTLEGPVGPEALLDLDVSKIYLLDAGEIGEGLREALDARRIFRFAFNYSSGFDHETGFLVANQHGVFAIIGAPVSPQWCEPEQVPEDVFEDAVLEDDDDLDFSM